MPWNGATGAIARCKSRSTACAPKSRFVPAWRWICGVKPKLKAGNKPSPHSIRPGLDKPGDFTTVSIFHLPDADGGAVCLVVTFDGGCIGVTAVNRDRFGEPIAADPLLQKTQRGPFVTVAG